MGDDILALEEVSAGYGGVRVLWQVSLHVREGEVVALVGSNGAGKTTILRVISGFCRPWTGNVRFAGKSITGLDPASIARLGVGHVPQGRQLFPRMTVAENLAAGAAHLPHARPYFAKNLEWILHLFPILKERYRQPAGTLSGGEQQMLAIGRALAGNPRLLLVDEPSLGLSPLLVNTMFRTLREVQARGVTVLLVEQNVRQSLAMSQRAYVVENGRIVLEGQGPALLRDLYVQKAYLGGTRPTD